jgi:hypothetical protein
MKKLGGRREEREGTIKSRIIRQNLKINTLEDKLTHNRIRHMGTF